MYSELEKWLTIRKMVEEKYTELKRAVEALSMNYSSFNKAIQKSNTTTSDYLREICGWIKSRFLTPENIKVYKTDWISNLSSVDLLHLFSYLNDVLRCFYHYIDIAVDDIKLDGDMLTSYNMRRCGDVTNNKSELFSRFMKSVRRFGKPNPNHPNEVCYEVDKFFLKQNIEYSGKPIGDGEEYVDINNIEYRKAVVALLVEDAVKRYNKTIKSGDSLVKNAISVSQKVDFDSAKKEFCLASRREQGFGITNLPKPYSEGFHFRDVESDSKSFVGVDEHGRPIEKTKSGDYYNSLGEKLFDEDVFYTPTDFLD